MHMGKKEKIILPRRCYKTPPLVRIRFYLQLLANVFPEIVEIPRLYSPLKQHMHRSLDL